MNNEIYNRLVKLLQGIGISFSEKGISNGEIYAYANAIQNVKAKIKATIDEIFMLGTSVDDLSKYISLLKIEKGDKSYHQLKAIIQQRLGQAFGDFDEEIFNNAFSQVGSGKYTITANGITFSGVNGDDLERLGLFVSQYVPAFIRCKFSQSGLTFDNWEALDKSFFAFDNMDLPFEIIDTLGSDIL
jgi:hypothetical protein